MTSTDPTIPFPCTEVPANPNAARLVGLYPQIQEGRYMQRIRVPGGVLSAAQWRGLAALVRTHTPTAPLHLTTRQDIELHDVTPERVGAVQQGLAEAGLTSVGACGDTFRNITVCPCAGTRAGGIELGPAANVIAEMLRATPGVYSLPRKFKIALACGSACGQPWINDLGFVARRRDGQWGFEVIGAGSLGAKPATGIRLWEWIGPERVLPLVAAAIRVFAAHGDRENRRRARFRHIRQRVGDERFGEMLTAAMDEAERQGPWAAVPIPTGEDLPARRDLAFADGDVQPAAAEALAGALDRGVSVRIANHHRVAVFASSPEALDATLGGGALPVAANAPAVVACPGKDYCKRAIVYTRSVASELRDEVTGVGRADRTVCVSGCPNGCAHSRVADVGLVGRLVRRDGRRREGFDVYAGGGMGRTGALAELHQRGVPADKIAPRVSELVARAAEEDNGAGS
ncbi:MAG: hypothetical protein ACOC8F_05570 [Planctomycetota bacterium]